MKVMVVGDIHSEFGMLNTLMNRRPTDITIVCGDIAYFWCGENAKYKIKPKGKVYLVPGNHEDYFTMQRVVGRHSFNPVELEENVFWCPIGSSIKVNDTKILFVGGAESHDKNQRMFMVDWFPEEVLNSKDVDFILDNTDRADIIISHTAPLAFDVKLDFDYRTDPTRHALSILLEKFKPSLWYFGHFHKYITGIHKNTKWTGLNMIQDCSRYFEILNI